MFAHAEPVVVLTPQTSVDPYSSEAAPDWTLTPTSRDEAAAVAPSAGDEPLVNGRTPVDSDFALYFDHDPQVAPSDRVTVRGLTCDVVGHQEHYINPWSGWEAGYVVRVKIREG